jgi:Galactose oxidase, central domain
MSNICRCDPGFTGLICQAVVQEFTARQRHSITFVESLDIAVFAFGRNFHTTVNDMLIYNFSTTAWKPIATVEGSPSPTPRFDHITFWFNSKLYLYGGQNANQFLFGDLWIYDIAMNTWTSVPGITGPAPLLYEPTVVVVPSPTDFQIFVTGGISRSGTINMNMFSFYSGDRRWKDLGYTPISYQGGSGVYHSETNSINFAMTGNPNYDLAYNDAQIYSWKYSIDTGIWSPNGLRSPAEVLYLGKAVYDTETESVFVHGGLSLNSAEKCFQSRLWQFDLGLIRG